MVYSGDSIQDTDGGVLRPISSVMRNRIINGQMVIDQRNAGASVTPTNGAFTLDRWVAALSQTSKFSVQQNAGPVTPPAGFTNYLGVTSLSAYTVGAAENFLIQQRIEGYNVADLGWGTANAKTVTLSFWVRSSLTGTFGGALRNSNSTRSYPFSYLISSANTWEQKSITVAGETTGTWLTTNGNAISVVFGLGVGPDRSGTAGAWASTNYTSATGATSVVGTNGATFYITGVQLEVGTQATSFEYRQIQQELALCQRYYYKNTAGATRPFGSSFNTATTSARGLVPFPVTMRISPTALEQSGTASDYQVFIPAGVVNCSSVPTYSNSSAIMAQVIFPTAGSLTAGQGSQIRTPNANGFLAWSAEL
jgi:hypothetical protein